MKSIIDKNTGELICCTAIEIEVTENQVLIDKVPTENFVKAFLNFANNEFYEGASQEEINESNKLKVPFEVPLWAMRTVLKQSGLFQVIIDVIETLEEPTRTIALDFLEYGNFVERKSNTVIMIQSISQMTDEQVDQLFIEANKLKL